jgi:O-antigen ligase
MLNKFSYERTYYYLTILLALTMPLSRAAVSLFIVLLPLLWLIEGDLKNKLKEIFENKVLFSFLIFISIMLLSLLWTSSYEDASRPLRMLLYFFTMFVVATSIKKDDVPNILTFFLIGMFISEVLTYGVFFGFWQVGNATPTYLSPFMYHIDYSLFLGFAASILLYRVLSKDYSYKQKAIFLLFFITVCGNLFLSIGRTGQVALFGAIALISFLHFKISMKSIFITLALVTTVFTSAYTFSTIFQKRVSAAISDIEKLQNSNFNTSLGTRGAFYITTYNIIKENPLLGVGIGDYMDETHKEVQKEKYDDFADKLKEFLSTNTPHNQFLLILMQTGFLGLISFFYFLYRYITQENSNKELKALSLVFITVYCISAMAETFFMNQFGIALFSLFIGLFSITNKKDETYENR